MKDNVTIFAWEIVKYALVRKFYLWIVKIVPRICPPNGCADWFKIAFDRDTKEPTNMAPLYFAIFRRWCAERRESIIFKAGKVICFWFLLFLNGKIFTAFTEYEQVAWSFWKTESLSLQFRLSRNIAKSLLSEAAHHNAVRIIHSSYWPVGERKPFDNRLSRDIETFLQAEPLPVVIVEEP